MSSAARRWGGLWTCGVALTLPLTLAAPAGASSSGRNGGFAFQAEFGFKGMDADAIVRTGPRARALLQVLDYGSAEQSYQSGPDWSPDGHWLAWGSNKSGHRLMISRANGSHRRTVFGSAHDSVDNPAWSPTGRRLAFTHYGNIYTIHRNGTHLRRILHTQSRYSSFYGLDWSARGQLVASSSVGKLFTIRPDGTHRHSLGTFGFGPDWAPHGGRVAYVNTSEHISIMRANGSHKHSLGIKAHVNCLSWAPDGSRIAYISNSDDALLTVRLDGRGTKMLGSPHGVMPGIYLAWRPL